jgi:hypothetical protein
VERAGKSVLALAAIGAVLAALLASSPAGAEQRAKPDFEVYASCANAKPFPPASRCGYDARERLRATFVFRSNVGKRVVKACFKIFGRPPVGGGHACYKLGAIAYKAYPFKVTGVRQPFAVKVTWFAKPPGSGFKRAGSAFLRVHTKAD